MTVPNNLFIDTPEIEDVSMTSLSSDTSTWPEEIITKLKERIPGIAAMSCSVKFMHIDEENGTATGSVTVTNGQKTIVVPLVIKEFSLYPMDIFMMEGKMLPLMPDFFAQVFMDGSESAFKELLEYPLMSMVDRYMRGENLQNVVFPPNWGRYAFASAVPEGILKDLEGTIDGGEIHRQSELEQAAFARFFSNGMAPLVKAISHMQPVNMKEFRQGVEKLINRNIHVLSKDGPNRYTLLSSQSGNYNPAISAMDRTQAWEFCSKVCANPGESMHEVDQNGEKILTVIDDSGSEIFLAKPQRDQPDLAIDFGRYNVRNVNGINVEGVVVPNVINFDQAILPTKLFLGKTMSTMQENIVGTRIVGDGNWMPEGDCPKVGQTGTFLYHEGERGAVATEPVTIKSMWKECDKVVMKVIDLYGHEVKLHIACHEDHKDMSLQRIARLDANIPGQGKEYMIPSTMKWIPMEGFGTVSGSKFEYLSKTASHRLTNDPVIVMHTGYGQYAVRGLDKYAHAVGWDIGCLSSAQAKFLLAANGASEAKVNEIIKEAASASRAEVHGLKKAPLWEEKVAAYIPRAQEMIKAASALKCNLFKVASYMENAQTVDAMLSLNFVSADNIQKFIAKIPLFKAAISHLASCLLASRLGIKEIPEQSASGAMGKMVDVVRGLETLRATQAQQTKR